MKAWMFSGREDACTAHSVAALSGSRDAELMDTLSGIVHDLDDGIDHPARLLPAPIFATTASSLRRRCTEHVSEHIEALIE